MHRIRLSVSFSYRDRLQLESEAGRPILRCGITQSFPVEPEAVVTNKIKRTVAHKTGEVISNPNLASGANAYRFAEEHGGRMFGSLKYEIPPVAIAGRVPSG